MTTIPKLNLKVINRDRSSSEPRLALTDGPTTLDEFSSFEDQKRVVDKLNQQLKVANFLAEQVQSQEGTEKDLHPSPSVTAVTDLFGDSPGSERAILTSSPGDENGFLLLPGVKNLDVECRGPNEYYDREKSERADGGEHITVDVTGTYLSPMHFELQTNQANGTAVLLSYSDGLRRI